MAIVYLHKRKIDQQIFYVGIGKDKHRAYNRMSRNKPWKNYTSKYEYTVEIIHENVSYQEAQKIEIELITLYGRRDLGLGPLVNLTNGGDDSATTKNRKKVHKNGEFKLILKEELDSYIQTGWKLGHTDEVKQKIGNSNRGKIVSDEAKQKMRKPKSEIGRLNIKKAAQNRKGFSEETKALMSKNRKGRPKSEEWKQKIRKPKGPQNIVTCTNCKQSGGISNMKRYHFENCKLKKVYETGRF